MRERVSIGRGEVRMGGGNPGYRCGEGPGPGTGSRGCVRQEIVAYAAPERPYKRVRETKTLKSEEDIFSLQVALFMGAALEVSE